MFNDVFIGLITINGEPYKSRSKIAVRNINKKLKIPIKKINVFSFKKRKVDGIYVDLDLLSNHREVMNMALEKKYKYCMIFEDDVDFINNADKILRKNLEFAKYRFQNWGVLYLGCKTHTPIFKIKHNLYKTFWAAETHAFIIKDWCMRSILNKIPKDRNNINDKCTIRLNWMNDSPSTLCAMDGPLYIPFCDPIMIYPSISYQSVCCRWDKIFLNRDCNSKYIEDQTNRLYKNIFYVILFLFFLLLCCIYFNYKYFGIILLILIIILCFPTNLSIAYLYYHKIST